MKPTIRLLALTLLLTFMATDGVAAQDQPQHPPQEQQGPPWSYEESQAFNAATSAQNNLAKQIQLGEEFLAKFPNSALTPLMRRRLVGLYVAPPQNLKKAFEMAEAYFNSTHEKYAEAFKLLFGPSLEKPGATLPLKPTEDFTLLAILISSANSEVKSPAHVHEMDEQYLKHAQWAQNVIGAGGVPPTIIPANWKTGEKAVSALVHQTIGVIKVHRKEYAEAIEELNKAGRLEPTDPGTFYLIGEVVLSTDYAKLGGELDKMRKDYDKLVEEIKQIEDQVNKINDELSKLPDTPRNKARIEQLQQQGKELSEQGKTKSTEAEQLSGNIDKKVAEVDDVVDKMIQAYAKTVALSDKKGFEALQQQARTRLEQFYRYRHQGSLDGLDKLIQDIKGQSSSSSGGN
jgi:tetratricopeptide (TPR) repeat protein